MEALLEHPSASYGALPGVRKPSVLEAGFIAKSLGPLIVTFILQFLLETVTIFACGQLGAQELAVASLALCSFNITALAFYQGMSTCLDSFCSQAFGAGRPLMVGVYFQRCSLMMLAVTVFPLLPLWWFSGSVLKLMVPNEELAMLCQTFLRALTLGVPGLLFFETGKRFFQAQHIFNAGTYALAVLVPIHLVLNWLLVVHPKYSIGLLGAPIALSVSFWLITIFMLLYAVFVNGSQCWGGLDLRKAMVNWNAMLKLALPGVVMVAAEYLAFEVMTILAASFGTSALAAQSIGANVGAMVFQVPFAVSVAVSTRVGHLVGIPKPSAAKKVSRLSLMLGAAMGLMNFVIVFAGKSWIALLYSGDKEVIATAGKVLTLAALNQFGDCMNIVSAGILRGQGRQRIGSYLNLLAYYLFALPMAYVLAFVFDYEVYGLWMGLSCGVLLLALCEIYCVVTSDWEKVIEDCNNQHDH